MKTVIAVTLTAATLAVAAAAGQDGVPIPGMMTQAKVLIQNAGRTEAIPVAIEHMSADAPPVRVEVIGTTEVAMAPGVVLQARAARQQWDHRTMTVPADQDPAAVLAKAGLEGWEAVGLAAGAKGTTLVLMKRPR